MAFTCPGFSGMTPNCPTMIDCQASQESFSFNGGITTDLVCGSTVRFSLRIVDCLGDRAPAAGAVAVSSSTGTVTPVSSSGTLDVYDYTLPDTAGTQSVTFTWGNSNDASLCSRTITYTCDSATVCDTIIDCQASQESFNFNGGDFIDLQCGSVVQMSARWIDCEGNPVQGGLPGLVPMSADIGDVNFVSNTNGLILYNYTLPDTPGNHSPVFTWGNSNDPVLCTTQIMFNCVGDVVMPPSDHVDGVAVLAGYGTGSLFGNNGRTIVVSNLNNSGPGSFRDAVETQSGPRKVVFTVSGVVPTPTRVQVNSGNLTIDGSTAPGTGFSLQATPENNGFVYRSSAPDVYVNNIGFYQNNDNTGQVDNRDVVSITSGASRNVMNQCTVMWAVDENAGTFDSLSRPTDGTWQYCLIAEGLSQAGHSFGEHSKGLLIGQDIQRMTVHHNYFVGNAQRNPRAHGDLIQIINNVILASCGDRFRGIMIGDRDANAVDRYDISCNRVYGTAGQSKKGALIYPPQTFGAGAASIYSFGNIRDVTRTSNSQPEIDFYGGFAGNPPPNFNPTGTPHVGTTPSICTYPDVTNDDLRDHLFQCVGAHSWNRKANDRRVLNIQPNAGCTNTAVQLY